MALLAERNMLPPVPDIVVPIRLELDPLLAHATEYLLRFNCLDPWIRFQIVQSLMVGLHRRPLHW